MPSILDLKKKMKDLTQFYSLNNDLNLKNNKLKHLTFDNDTRTLFACDDLMLFGIDTENGKVFV